MCSIAVDCDSNNIILKSASMTPEIPEGYKYYWPGLWYRSRCNGNSPLRRRQDHLYIGMGCQEFLDLIVRQAEQDGFSGRKAVWIVPGEDDMACGDIREQGKQGFLHLGLLLRVIDQCEFNTCVRDVTGG